MPPDKRNATAVSGEFVTLDDERYYVIRNVDRMAPFFISVVSESDYWMFIASNGGLTAGRVSADYALFPYVTVDKIYDSALHTGSKTIVRVDGRQYWEPFNCEHDARYRVTRNLYKNTLGNKLVFEEINDDLQLRFRYSWASAPRYGWVRTARLDNVGATNRGVELIDGVQNILAAGTPRHAQTNTSYLVDAYKWSELDEETGLAWYTLYSAISDRAEPRESLTANTAFCVGLDDFEVLLSSAQLSAFKRGERVAQTRYVRGVRGAYLVHTSFDLAPGSSRDWHQAFDVALDQAQVVYRRHWLRDPLYEGRRARKLPVVVRRSSDTLARIVAEADGFQHCGEETVSVHHYANVLFNTMRGGVFANQCQIEKSRLVQHLRRFNPAIYEGSRAIVESLPDHLPVNELLQRVREHGEPQLERLALEYLPLNFGRRHGDPSRPWNEFAIRLTDPDGNPRLSYQGNWRDIFQNWEALLFSFPAFTESVIAKFVNASTVDGYNPYRITDEGIDWEVEEPEDPWSYIGYWGDHQIIYLQKLLELSQRCHPERLRELLRRRLFSYANVPYRIKPFAALLDDAKDTIVYDKELAATIDARVAEIGADGKLVVDANDEVVLVNLLEKLLVPLLAKLGNLVVDGGIWLNTQRPEWNDANNALVGHGLSMVTLCYLRRYVRFLSSLLDGESEPVSLSTAVGEWLQQTASALASLSEKLGRGPVAAEERYRALAALGQAASDYRDKVYAQQGFTGQREVSPATIRGLLDDALAAIEHSIATSRRDDGLYHAYNLIHAGTDSIEVEHLYTMLEGQVAALSSGAVAPAEAADLVDTLFASDLYRSDQQSFLLYPDRHVPGYFEKNCIPASRVKYLSLPADVTISSETGERVAGTARLPGVLAPDWDGNYRFNADLVNARALDARLDELAAAGETISADLRAGLHEIYEEVFNHKAFTGRSGGMFAFEGLGSIYWHMVAKLLLAVQEIFFAACDDGTDAATLQRLGAHYYRIRDGLGFNKTPLQYGAFPTDPYSHTPGHIGAQQPGLTGQVKEEVLTRFGELGIRVADGTVRFDPSLLRAREFCAAAGQFRYRDIAAARGATARLSTDWQTIDVPAGALAFTWCQVPIIYRLDNASGSEVQVSGKGLRKPADRAALSAEDASEIFNRTGKVRKLEVTIPRVMLYEPD